MPYTAQHKNQSRQRILASAYKLFSSRGFDNVSIDEVMADAKLTRGGFYAHFSNKSELYREAIRYAAENSEIIRRKPECVDERSWIKNLIQNYLHSKNVGDHCGCPLASLVTDVTVRDADVRKAYTDTFKGMNRLIYNYAQSFSEVDHESILATTAMIIGGLAIARALDDDALVDQLLKSCQKESMKILDAKIPAASEE